MIPVNSISCTIAVLSITVLVTACASTPDTSAASTGYASVEQLEGDPDRMVCKRQQDTGSRLSSRVCKTAREWEQERLDNQEAMRNATKSGVSRSNMPSAGGG